MAHLQHSAAGSLGRACRGPYLVLFNGIQFPNFMAGAQASTYAENQQVEEDHS